jgi:hypothetical protein
VLKNIKAFNRKPVSVRANLLFRIIGLVPWFLAITVQKEDPNRATPVIVCFEQMLIDILLEIYSPRTARKKP